MSNLFSGTDGSSKKTTTFRTLTLMGLILLGVFFSSCTKQEEPEDSFNIAVFVPGVVSGSPIYEMLAAGAQKAADEHAAVQVNIIEGGSNQGEWEEKIATLAASGDQDVIITSNPAMPGICAAVSDKFPSQYFIIMDGFLEGNDHIYTLRYNQQQQAMMNGHLAGLVTTSQMDGANDQLIIGLIAGQEYPDMTNLIAPGFLEGAKQVNDSIKLDFRAVGNWYDAAKGAELARAMISAGVDIILPIAGGANQGVITAAHEAGIYVLWFDANGYAQQPGTVVGSTSIQQDTATYETLTQAIEGTLPYGEAVTLGLESGFITFIEDDELYITHVPQDVREAQKQFLGTLK